MKAETIDDGGPVHPTPDPDFFLADDPRRPLPGISLRDWFAGQALPGVLSHPDYDYTPTLAARMAYQIADAMLRVREQRQ